MALTLLVELGKRQCKIKFQPSSFTSNLANQEKSTTQRMPRHKFMVHTKIRNPNIQTEHTNNVQYAG
ncbi:hypothetical protein ARMGADRAFT_1003849 [Armillaria gallica]|uniref:Uncharacterized protein n=1 Tax=Armillaria gallica TaxID=47427 RepID=A0A2H3E6H9_ARMGA|nr:hypothetical protein ARMGADRAFT_1019726 [Armillaria gallica]PBL03040.1 hypothetical protein ARMGADRAFT_1003849 [Armillaria gallica]